MPLSVLRGFGLSLDQLLLRLLRLRLADKAPHATGRVVPGPHGTTRSAAAMTARCMPGAVYTRGWLVALALCPSACASGSRSNAVPNLFDTQQRIAAYIDAGRYAADCATVTAQARAYLDRRARQVPRPAAVFDIDETSLSNWPAYRANGWARLTSGECDLEKGPCGLRAWQAMAKSKAIPAT